MCIPLNLHKCCIQCMSYSRPAITANMAKLHSCVARQALTVSQSLHAAILYRKERDTKPTKAIWVYKFALKRAKVPYSNPKQVWPVTPSDESPTKQKSICPRALLGKT